MVEDQWGERVRYYLRYMSVTGIRTESISRFIRQGIFNLTSQHDVIRYFERPT